MRALNASLAVALVAACGCNDEHVAGIASVPPTATPDLGGAPDGGAPTGGGPSGPCSSVPTQLVSGIGAAAYDGTFLYGFGGGELRRVPLAGGTPAAVVSPVETNRARYLMVDDRSVYWVQPGVGGSSVDAIVRAPRDGGTPAVIGWGNGISALVVADVVYFVSAGYLRSVPRDGGLATSPIDRAAFLAGSGATLAWVGPGIRSPLHTQPLDEPVRATSLGVADSDGMFLFAAVPGTTDVLRYQLSDATITPITQWSGNGNVVVRAFDDVLYVGNGGGPLMRVGKDGSSAARILELLDPSPTFVIVGDSVYYAVGESTWRVCR